MPFLQLPSSTLLNELVDNFFFLLGDWLGSGEDA